MAKTPAPSNIDEYVSGFERNTREILENIRAIIRNLAPKATETLSYGIPTYKLDKNLVHFAGYKNHIGFYPSPEVISHFREQLSGYKTAKGSVQFPLTNAIPYDLIEKMTRYRLRQLRGDQP